MLDTSDMQITALDLAIIGRVLRRIAKIDSVWIDGAPLHTAAKRDARMRLEGMFDEFWNDERGALRNAHVADLARMYTMGRMSRIDILPAETVKAFDNI